MDKVISFFRLGSAKNCAQNVWFSFLAILIVMSANFRALILPLWLLLTVAIAIAAFSFFSFCGVIYWMVVPWKSFEAGVRLLKFFYVCILGVIDILTIYIVVKILNLVNYVD